MIMRIAGLLLVSALCGGCSFAKITPLASTDILENRYVLFTAPSGGWYVFDGETWHKNGSGEIVNLNAQREGSHYDISVNTFSYNEIPAPYLFDRNHELPLDKTGVIALTANDKEQGISYKRGWATYVQGMKCTGKVFSRRFGGSVYEAMSKDYSVWCGYYHRTEGKRLVFFRYRYNYALGDTRLQEDKGKDRSELLTQPQAEEGLKQAMKELVGSLEIKNLDRERMEREGLWHPGKPFDVSEF